MRVFLWQTLFVGGAGVKVQSIWTGSQLVTDDNALTPKIDPQYKNYKVFLRALSVGTSSPLGVAISTNPSTNSADPVGPLNPGPIFHEGVPLDIGARLYVIGDASSTLVRWAAMVFEPGEPGYPVAGTLALALERPVERL